MKKTLVIVAALGSLAGALPASVSSATAETVIIHRGRDCHMVRDVKFTPHGKVVVIHKVCN